MPFASSDTAPAIFTIASLIVGSSDMNARPSAPRPGPSASTAACDALKKPTSASRPAPSDMAAFTFRRASVRALMDVPPASFAADATAPSMPTTCVSTPPSSLATFMADDMASAAAADSDHSRNFSAKPLNASAMAGRYWAPTAPILMIPCVKFPTPSPLIFTASATDWNSELICGVDCVTAVDIARAQSVNWNEISVSPVLRVGSRVVTISRIGAAASAQNAPETLFWMSANAGPRSPKYCFVSLRARDSAVIPAPAPSIRPGRAIAAGAIATSADPALKILEVRAPMSGVMVPIARTAFDTLGVSLSMFVTTFFTPLPRSDSTRPPDRVASVA